MTSSGDFVQQRHRDPRSTGELIRLALNEEDEHAAWDFSRRSPLQSYTGGVGGR
jgi:hypothetical protein